MGGKKVFELMLEIGHKSQPLKSKLPNGYTHKWSVFVKGANDSKIEHCIQRVVFQLHDSFPDPHRDKFITNKLPPCHRKTVTSVNSIEITSPPFQVKETGYAGFEIPIEVYFKNRDKTNHVVFMLDLMLLTDKPNNASRVEKVKFYNPNRDFEKCLVKSGAQLLSVTKDKKERSGSPPAKKQKSYSLIPSKDMSNKQTGQQAQSHSHNSNNNFSHSSSASLTSQNHVLPSSQTQPQPHHKSNSSQLNHNHHGSSSYNNNNSNNNHNSHSNNSHNNIGNHTSSNSVFGNQASHHSNHQTNNHLASKASSQQQQSLLPKPKSSSRELMDVFGAPLVYNNNKSQKTSNGKDQSLDNSRDVPMATSNNPSPVPPPSAPVARQPTSQASTPQSHSHHHKSSHHHHHHHKKHHHNHHHHQNHTKQEPTEAPKPSPLPPVTAQLPPIPKKTPPKEPPPQAVASAFIAQADPFQAIQSKISSLTDGDKLQEIVDIIDESGEWFNLTPNKFEFDLKRLDKKTLSKIERCLPR